MHQTRPGSERCTFCRSWQRRAHPSQLVVGDGAGVHEGLGDDGQHGVHVVRGLHVEDELRVLQDVDPEAQRQAVRRDTKVVMFIKKAH